MHAEFFSIKWQRTASPDLCLQGTDGLSAHMCPLSLFLYRVALLRMYSAL